MQAGERGRSSIFSISAPRISRWTPEARPLKCRRSTDDGSRFEEKEIRIPEINTALGVEPADRLARELRRDHEHELVQRGRQGHRSSEY
jgi:hypothetical protein